MEAKRKGRPRKIVPPATCYQVDLVIAALIEVSATPVDDLNAPDLIERHAEVFDQVFAAARSPDEVVRKLVEILKKDDTWRGTEADIEELVAKAYLTRIAERSHASLSRPEPPRSKSTDGLDTETAGPIGKAPDGSTAPLSTIEPLARIDAARHTTGLPDPVQPFRAAMTSPGSITSAKAIAQPATSLPFARPADRLKPELRTEDPAVRALLDPKAPEEERRVHGGGHLEEPISTAVPKDGAANKSPAAAVEIAEGWGTNEEDDGYERYGLTDSS